MFRKENRTNFPTVPPIAAAFIKGAPGDNVSRIGCNNYVSSALNPIPRGYNNQEKMQKWADTIQK